MPQAIDMGSMATACGTKDAPMMEEWWVAGENGAAANVLVYVKSGPVTQVRTPVPRSEAVLEQKHCIDLPHVIGIRAGQPLRIRNEDSTPHGVLLRSKFNGDWNALIDPNTSLLAGEAGSVGINRAEIPVRIGCAIHPWMRATVGVFDHDAFCVTGKDGVFKLAGLPPGESEVDVYHERFAANAQQVTVGENETRDVRFVLQVE